MHNKISKKIKEITPSASIVFSKKVALLESQNHKIYKFNVGEPNFYPHANIITATKKALETGKVRYGLVAGELQLRTKISLSDSKKYNVKLNPENILIANGSKNILYSIFQMICNPDDEVIISKPFWVSFPEQVKLAGAKPIFVDSNDDFSLNLNLITESLSKNTKAILLNFPNNPSGDVPSDQQIQQLIKLTEDRKIFLMIDLAYEELIYNQTIIDLQQKLPDHLFLIKSFSKSFALTGFRIGYTIASQKILMHLNALQGHLCGNVCSFAQYGALETFNLPASYLQTLKENYQKKMMIMYQIIKDIFPNLKPAGGGFYLFVNATSILSQFNMSDFEFCQRLLESKHVAILPGSVFGMANHLRICFASSTEDIKIGMNILKEFILENTNTNINITSNNKKSSK